MKDLSILNDRLLDTIVAELGPVRPDRTKPDFCQFNGKNPSGSNSELSRSLNSMSKSVPYKDVKSAVNELIECTSNVLTVSICRLIFIC